jgi:hypothetical protein
MSLKCYFRALDELFRLVGTRSPSSPALARYRITLSYIEIYKEELRDLLDGGGVVQQPLVIREDEQGNTGASHVLGYRMHEISSPALACKNFSANFLSLC